MNIREPQSLIQKQRHEALADLLKTKARDTVLLVIRKDRNITLEEFQTRRDAMKTVRRTK